jgi:hypothetical protein
MDTKKRPVRKTIVLPSKKGGLIRTSSFSDVDRIVRSLFTTGDQPGKGILLVLDVDDTLLVSRSNTIVPTDPNLSHILKQLVKLGVRLKILTARVKTQTSIVELHTHLLKLDIPCTNYVTQHAIMTGAQVDKGTALLSRKQTLQNVRAVVFVDDMVYNHTDVYKAMTKSYPHIVLRNILYNR